MSSICSVLDYLDRLVRVGAPESDFRVGERVSAFGVPGGYAERVAVPLSNVVSSPSELDDAHAVSLLANLKPPAPQRYPLSEAQAALQCPADGGVLGKLVLEP